MLRCMSMQPETPTVTAALIVIGNEVLSGRTRDANLQFLATGLGVIGIQLRETRVIPDIEAEIVAAINDLGPKHDYVLTTGGIGPTHDDITSAAVAAAFDRPFGRNAEAEEILRAHYKPEDITEARLSMADMPDNVTLIDNPVSRAPGFRIENVIVLPGVPRIMQAMFDGYKHNLSGGAEVKSISITSAVQEGRAAKQLGELQEKYPDVEMGSYPFVRDGKVGTSLVARSGDLERLEAAAEGIRDIIRSLGGEPMDD